jgi:hypothetical protein
VRDKLLDAALGRNHIRDLKRMELDITKFALL